MADTWPTMPFLKVTQVPTQGHAINILFRSFKNLLSSPAFNRKNVVLPKPIQPKGSVQQKLVFRVEISIVTIYKQLIHNNNKQNKKPQKLIANTYIAMLVGDIVGQLEFMERHYLGHPLFPCTGGVRVDVHPFGHLWISFACHHPPGVVELVAAVVHSDNVHQ